MEYETISGEECLAVMRGDKIIRKSDDEDNKGPMGSAVPVAGKQRPRRRAGCGRSGAPAADLSGWWVNASNKKAASLAAFFVGEWTGLGLVRQRRP